MRARTPAALLLFAFLALIGYTPSPVVGQGKDPQKDKEKDKEKEKDKDSAKPTEFTWPTNIGGNGLPHWLKDATENPDPAVREFSLKTLPNFGPDARKACSKKLLSRMTREPDPGVRLTVFTIVGALGFEDSELADGIQILGNVIDNAADGGLSRLVAIQSIARFGSKAEGAMIQLTGRACSDPAYETRRTLANALARVGFNEKTGPNLKALNRLAATFAKDQSAAVRMEALQSLVLLGPPWAETRKADDKNPPKISWKDATTVADRMRDRLVVTKTKGIVESDKQLEIWCRVVLMRFDEKELATDVHLTAIAQHLDAKSELGPKLQALQALALFGERAGTKVDDVVPVLLDEDPLVLATALNTVAAMGVKGKPAIDKLKEAEKNWTEKREKRKQEEDYKKTIANLKPEQIEQLISILQEEQMRKSISNTIEYINNSKPGKPGGDPPVAPAPMEKKP